MIYLASPYSHSDAGIREQRYHDACQAATRLLQSGQPVFAPIVHGHPLVGCGLPTDWSFWGRICRHYLEACQQVVVLMLNGWEQSIGVRAEIEIATSLEKPVWYWAPFGPCLPTLAHVPQEASI